MSFGDSLSGCFSLPESPREAVSPATYHEETDGTITATVYGQTYSRVPIAGGARPSDGDVGAVGYLQRNSQRQPVWLGTAKQHHRTRSRGTDTDVWSRATGNRLNSFQSLVGLRLAVEEIDTLISEILSSDHSLDPEVAADWGAGSILVAYRTGGRTMLAALTATTGVGAYGFGFKAIVVGYDLATPETPAWSSAPGDGISGIPAYPDEAVASLCQFYHTHQVHPMSLQYCEALDLLALIHPGHAQGTKAIPYTRIVLMAASAMTVGEMTFEPGEFVRESIVLGSVAGGCAVVEDLLVSAALFARVDAAQRQLNIYSDTIPPPYEDPLSEEAASSGSFRAYDLTSDTLDLLWFFNPRTVASGAAHPIIYNPARTTGGKAYAFGPGNVPAYSKKRKAVFVAWAGRDGIPLADPLYPASFSSSDIIPENWTAAVSYDNQHATSGTASNEVSSDAYIARAWLASINSLTGELRASYAFPPLDARDEANYIVDSASFTFSLGAFPSLVQLGFTNVPYASKNQSLLGMLSEGQLDLSAGSYATSGHPDYEAQRPIIGSLSDLWNTETWATMNLTGTDANIGVQQYLFPHYLHWPAEAGYHFDACPYLERATSGWNNAAIPHQPQLTLDASDNLYMHYLQPVGVISARDSRTGSPMAAARIASATMPTTPAPTGGEITLEWFGVPRRYTMYRSFATSFDGGLARRWTRETTTYLTDTESDSGLSLPFGSHIFRQIATAAGIYVLRTERVTFAAMPIGYYIANRAGLYTKAYMQANYPFVNQLAGDHEPLLWARVVLELWNRFDGTTIWRRVLWDPSEESITTPTCAPAAFMVATERGVTGRVDHCAATWGSSGSGFSYSNYSLSGLEGIMFSATSAGVLTTRAATNTDPQAAGINLALDNKARVNAAHAYVGGTLYHNSYSPPPSPGLSKWTLSRMVVDPEA